MKAVNMLKVVLLPTQYSMGVTMFSRGGSVVSCMKGVVVPSSRMSQDRVDAQVDVASISKWGMKCKADSPDMGDPSVAWERSRSMNRRSRRWVLS